MAGKHSPHRVNRIPPAAAKGHRATTLSEAFFTDTCIPSADEPRRSGRATKGQHNKDRDINEDAAVTTKKKGKGKGAKAKVVEEEEEEQEEVIRCVCGTYSEEEDEPRAMICCDNCAAWQHNSCMGLPEDYEVETYFCEQCKPENHKKLVAAMARGEKPWEEVIRKREQALAEKAKKKGGRKGRKSAGAKTEEVPVSTPQETQEPETQPTPATTPAPAVATSGQKRKLEESPSVPEIKVCFRTLYCIFAEVSLTDHRTKKPALLHRRIQMEQRSNPCPNQNPVHRRRPHDSPRSQSLLLVRP